MAGLLVCCCGCCGGCYLCLQPKALPPLPPDLVPPKPPPPVVPGLARAAGADVSSSAVARWLARLGLDRHAGALVKAGLYSADDLRAKLTPELLVAGGVPTAHGRLILLALGADDADGAPPARAFAYQGPAQ